MTDRTERYDVALLKAELVAAGAVFHGKECKCIFHEDKHASAGVYLDSQGVARFKCHSCDASGDVYDIRARIQGVTMAEVLPKGDRSLGKAATVTALPPKVYDSLEEIIRIASIKCGPWAATYEYPEDKSVVLRFKTMPDGKKPFRQAHQNCRGWLFKAPPKPWALYGLHSLASFEYDVIIVEGEKDADTLHALGLPAVTSRGGGGKDHARHSDWTALAGRSCVLWPDNDVKGQEYMAEVAHILSKIGAAVRVVDVSRLELPLKGDVSDYLERYSY